MMTIGMTIVKSVGKYPNFYNIIQGINSIYKEAIRLCEESKEKNKYLMTFQNLLSKIPDWSTTTIETERKRIELVSGCKYLEDLITCVHIIQLKALTCIRVGLKQTQSDPFEWFKDKAKDQIITVKVISTDNKGLTVRPEGCEMDFQIKKSAIAINSADARPSRWTGGEKLDCAIADLDLSKRKVTLSIKLLEEIEKKEALEKYGSEGSGKNLPFSSLSEDLKKKEEEKE